MLVSIGARMSGLLACRGIQERSFFRCRVRVEPFTALLVWAVLASSPMLAEPKVASPIQLDSQPGFGRFIPAASSRLNFGFIEMPVWIRFSVEATADAAPRLIEIGFALVDQIDLFVLRKKAGGRRSELVHTAQGGIRRPFAERERPYRYHIFELDLPQSGRYTVYLRLNTRNALVVVMVLYNLFLFAAIRDASYIYYVGTLVALHGMFQLCIDGLVPEIFSSLAFLQSGEAIARLTAASVCVG